LGAVAVSCSVFIGCGAEAPHDAPFRLGQWHQPFVNGGDDRREYFELDEPAERSALERSATALMTEDAAAAVVAGHVGALPTWSQVNQLCEDEPFGDQPAAAFCSGVLVDWNLVLTSGHCVDLVPLENLRVAFAYFYRDPGDLALTEADIYAVRRVIVARRDGASLNDAGERLDFAWLELAEPARPPHRPAPTYTERRGVEPNDAVISIGAGGGVPIKWDEGGHVQDIRADFDDYFTADTDTSQGSSGGGIFDGGLALLGSLARGAADFEPTEAGCYVTSTESEPSAAREQFTYAHRAVEALCATGSASVLCDSSCDEPCDAGLFGQPGSNDSNSDDSGCTVTPRGARRAPFVPGLLLGLAALVRRRSRPS
jgi:hypothetical protein